MSVADRRSWGRLTGWLWFGVWAAVGCGLAFAGISLVGPAVPLVALVGVPLLVWRGALHRPALGLASGMGVMLLVVAWIQRKGPGTVYWHTATASGADTYLDPRPWLIAGIVLAAGGVISFAFSERRAHHETRHRGRGERHAG
jgi:hypothetical protein